MGKFFIECPHCGTSNQASTFIFAKKVIECGHCKQEIDVKTNRITSRKCPHCKNIFLFDQKNDRNTCPVCKKSIGARFGKLVSFPCPECGCIMELSENAQTAHCAVCDHEIDVAKEVAKSKLVSDTGVSVIKYEGDNYTFVWKHPIEDFNLGSQLIVHESQEAIFFLNGQALDTFGPGRHTLETESLPILKKIQDLPTGKQNPFHAEVYFINKTVQMSIPWGTPDRVRFVDPETGAPIDIGASGEMNLQVADGRKLLIKLVGTTSGISWGTDKENAKEHHMNDRLVQMDPFVHSLRMYFKPLIRTMVRSNLAQIIKREKIDILEIDERLDDLSSALREKLLAGFEEYGLTIPQFYVTNISLPDDNDPNFQKIKKFHTEALQMRDIEYEKKMRLAKQEAEIEAQTGALAFDRIAAEKVRIAAEKVRIAAQADADKLTIKGTAINELRIKKGLGEAEVAKEKGSVDIELGVGQAKVIETQGVATGKAMEAQGYTKKDEFAKDAQVAWAGGIGQMGSNGGSGGGMMSEVVSMGAAMATMGAVTEKMQGAMKGISETDPATKDTPVVPNVPMAANNWDCACGHKGNTGKFCSECGKAKPEAWDCPSCGAKENKGKFCSECGTPKPEAWDCPSCGAKGNKGKFCSECGKAKNFISTWDCGCGQKNITGKFCPECGAKKEDNQS